MTKTKPILFNTEMVKAILDGRKTVTRRIADINTEIPCNDGAKDHEFVLDNFDPSEDPTGFVCRRCGFGVAPPYSRVPCGTSLFRPRYWPGDILYVRETWQYAYDADCNDQIIEETGRYIYAADGPAPFNDWIMPDGTHRDTMPWRPSIHMPKEAARIFLRVTNVKVERLQGIDGEQAFMEGADAEVPGILEAFEKNDMSIFPKNFEKYSAEKKADWYRSTATSTYIARCELAERLIKSFKKIWNSTIKPTDLPTCGWEANPWVWVIEFERISKGEATP